MNKEDIGKFFRDYKYILLLFFLSCLLFIKLILNPTNILYPAYDTNSWFLFQENVVMQGIRNFNTLPLWNNYYFSGMPLIGNSQISVFYPLNLFFLVFPTNLFISYSFLIHTFLTGVFTYLFCKKIGLEKFNSFLSATIFMLSGPIIGNIYPGHWVTHQAITFLPLLFLLLELVLEKRNIKYGILLGLAWGLQILAGDIQIFYFTSLALLFYFILRLFTIYREEKNGKSIVNIGAITTIAVLICVLVSSAYLLPTFEFSTFSNRSSGLEFNDATYFSFPFKHFISFLIPNFFGNDINNSYWGAFSNHWELSFYVGIFTLILAFTTLLFNRNKYTKIFSIMSVFSILFGFGRYTPFYGLFFKFLPGVNLFRNPAEQMIILIFTLAILAGHGSSFLLKPKIKKKQQDKLKILSNVMLILMISSLLVSITSLAFKGKILGYGEKIAFERYNSLYPDGDDFEQDYLPKIQGTFYGIFYGTIWFSVLFGTSTLLIFLKSRNIINSKNLRVFIISLILIDLLIFGIPFISTHDKSVLYERTEIIDFLEQDSSQYRILDLPGYINQRVNPIYGIEEITGYDPTMLGDYQIFLLGVGDLREMMPSNPPEHPAGINELENLHILNLLNTKYIISNKLLEVENNNFVLVFENEEYIAENKFNKFLENSDKMLPVYIYENKNVLPRAFVVSDSEIGELNIPYEYVEVEIIKYSPNKIVVETELDEPGLLILSEVWYPGWKAYDNGIEIEVIKTNQVLRGVLLEQGEHIVEFNYQPKSFMVGKAISLVTLLCASLFLIIIKFKKN